MSHLAISSAALSRRNGAAGQGSTARAARHDVVGHHVLGARQGDAGERRRGVIRIIALIRRRECPRGLGKRAGEPQAGGDAVIGLVDARGQERHEHHHGEADVGEDGDVRLTTRAALRRPNRCGAVCGKAF